MTAAATAAQNKLGANRDLLEPAGIHRDPGEVPRLLHCVESAPMTVHVGLQGKQAWPALLILLQWLSVE